jgi:hypothetical protein
MSEGNGEKEMTTTANRGPRRMGYILILFVAALMALSALRAEAWVYPEGAYLMEKYGEISTDTEFADVDADGADEILFGTGKGCVMALGEEQSRILRTGGSIKAAPFVIDYYRDGRPFVIAFVRDAAIDKPASRTFMVVIDGKSFKEIKRVAIDGSIVSAPAVWDFDGDGYPDFLVPSRGIYLISGNPKNHAILGRFDIDGVSRVSPVVADFNSDGTADFLISYTKNSKPMMDVFISQGRPLQYVKKTFALKSELTETPSLEQTADDTWRISARSTDGSSDAYVLVWNAKERNISLTFEKTTDLDAGD